MKKSLLVILSLSTSGFANVALSPSIPLYPEAGLFLAKESFATLKTGYYIDSIWKMHLKNKHDVSHATSRSLTQYAALSLCLSDLVDLWGFVGAQQNHLHFNKHHTPYKFKESNTYSWALFADGILNQWGKLQLGASAFYTSTPPSRGTLTNDQGLTTQSYYKYHAWGVSLGFSYDFPAIAPYARLDYQQSRASIQYFKKEFFHTMHPLGLAFGFISDLSHGFFADFEVRLIQTYATRLMLGLRF